MTKEQALEALTECASRGETILAVETPDEEACSEWTSQTSAIIYHAFPGTPKAPTHPRAWNFDYALGPRPEGRASFRPDFYGSALGRISHVVSDTRAKLKSLQETISWIEKGWLDDAFSGPHAGPMKKGGRGPLVQLNVSGGNASAAGGAAVASAMSSSSAAAAATMYWEQALDACNNLSEEKQDEARKDLADAKEALEAGAASAPSKLKKLLRHGADFGMAILPWLVSQKDNIIKVLEAATK